MYGYNRNVSDEHEFCFSAFGKRFGLDVAFLPVTGWSFTFRTSKYDESFFLFLPTIHILWETK